MDKKFGNAFYAEMDRIARFYPNKRAMLLPALHQAQAERGWISDETISWAFPRRRCWKS
jgi:NADH:ubiquinone oxidoreductase subunit E